MPSRPDGQTMAAAAPLRPSTTAATPHTLPRTLIPLLRARPPEHASAVTSLASSSPTSSTGNASFTAGGFRKSPRGTRSGVLAAEEPPAGLGQPVQAQAWALPLPLRLHQTRSRRTTSVGGLHDVTLAPSEAAGSDRHSPGGPSGNGRPVVYTKCLRSNFDRFGRLRGGVLLPQSQLFVPRRMSGSRSGPCSRWGPRSPSSPAGRPGTLWQAALIAHAGGCVRWLVGCSRAS